MADRMTETSVNEWLEARGALDESRQPGAYAIRLERPKDDPEGVLLRWRETYEAGIPDGGADRLADAGHLLYVGSHGESIYERLCQHARDHKSSRVMRVWPPTSVFVIEPDDAPERREYSLARELTGPNIAVWTDGTLL